MGWEGGGGRGLNNEKNHVMTCNGLELLRTIVDFRNMEE